MVSIQYRAVVASTNLGEGAAPESSSAMDYELR